MPSYDARITNYGKIEIYDHSPDPDQVYDKDKKGRPLCLPLGWREPTDDSEKITALLSIVCQLCYRLDAMQEDFFDASRNGH
jgi:hypothetical protein